MPIGRIEAFVVENNNWDAYIRRVNQFIALNNIANELKVATLVTVVGAQCYELMCDLCAPETPESKTFDQLVALMKEHLEPDRSEIAERHIFRQRGQRQGENVREYLQALKHLAKTCNFGTCLEVCLRDQFVSGLINEDMRSRIFAERGVDYKRAVELALALEAAERHAATACASGSSINTRTGIWHGESPQNDDGLHRIGTAGSGARAATGSGRGGSGVGRAQRKCSRCGKIGHFEGKCRFRNYSCDSCGEKGHLKVMCRKNSSEKEYKGQFFLNDSDSDEENCNFYNLVLRNDGDGPYYANLKVENIECRFEIDTGSKLSVISKKYYQKYFSSIPIQNKMLTLKSYTGNIIETIGYIVVNVICGKHNAKLKLFVINNGGPPLMGRTWIKNLKLAVVECYNLTDRDDESMASSLRKQFPNVFSEGLGTFKTKLQLFLKDDKPVFIKARTLPLALRQPVERELDRLQREGIIYKVDRSDYGTPIVPVIKANGSIRLCGDYKITINPLLKDYHYPLPRIEDLFAVLGGGEQYTKLDLTNAFQQCILQEESQPMTAITTHVGTFVYRRVPFGIKCIPENFQKIMEETLSGLPSTTVFADDICVTGKDKATHLNNLKAVLCRLQENGLKINFAKCQFFKDSVTYLGYKIDKFGLHTDSRKIEAIVTAPEPTNVTQLKSFMGLVNFYCKFCVNMSDILKPLYGLLKKSAKWEWTNECRKSFNKIKKVLSNAPVLAHYDPSLPLILSVDSSAYGVGAVLTQRCTDGIERPVSCASRTLNAAEVNYSQLDKEALAIMFGVKKHHHYVYGRHFTLRSDHRPLSYIFGNGKGIPVTAVSRLQRYAVKLAAYNFTIEFIPSSRNCFADALSRLPLNVTPRQLRGNDEQCSYLNFVQDNFPISFKDIKNETKRDRLLSKLYGYIMFNWPNRVNDKIEKMYWDRRHNMYIDQGCILWGYRIVVPNSLRPAILKEVHDGHPGVVKMKQIARNYVWWENLDADIEFVARECVACRQLRPAPPAAPLHSWPWPAEPWSRLHVDFLGAFNNRYFLVIIDAHSKWIEVEKVTTTSASVVIECLRKLFARFGLPKRIVSDNGPPFSSSEFSQYLERNGIRHTLIPPYHPSSNGAAENAVRSVKRVLKKAQIEGENYNTALSRFLFTYRNTEHSATGREPAVAMLGRRLRGRLDLLRPDAAERVRNSQLRGELGDAERTDRAGARTLRVLARGEPVMLRDYTKSDRKWTEGVVIERKSPVSYTVKASDGQIHKRHIDQLQTRKSRHSLSRIRTPPPDHSQMEYDISGTELTAAREDTDEKDEFFDSGGEAENGEQSRPTPPDPPSVITDNNNSNRVRRRAAIRCEEIIKTNKYK